MGTAPRMPGGDTQEFISVSVSDTSGENASLTANFLKNGKISDSKVIHYLSATNPVNFGFLSIQFVAPNWRIKSNASKVYNANSYPVYSGFKARGEELYAGTYNMNDGNNIVAATLIKR